MVVRRGKAAFGLTGLGNQICSIRRDRHNVNIDKNNTLQLP